MKIFKHLCLICFSVLIILGCSTKNAHISITDKNKQVNDFSSIIEKTKDSIVFISSSINENLAVNAGQNSICSGAVINPEGHIITNYHCIHRQKYIRVYFWDDDNWVDYSVNIIGEDPLGDLALLEVNDKDTKTPFLSFADNASVGEDVFALGHPMGLSWSVTKGIISNNERFARHPYIKAVQTDAAINKGNSGGPLLNMRGEIVAINALMVSRVQENAGVGVSIRGDIVKNSIEQMSKFGKYERPAIGVQIMEIIDENSRVAIQKDHPNLRKDHIPNTFGLFVKQTKDVPEGLKPFDTIIAVNDVMLNSGIELSDEIMKNYIGDWISLTVIRKRKYIKVEVKLKLFPVPIDSLYPKR
jgi:serine protease Do